MAPDGEREGTGTPREGSAGSGGRWARHDALPVVEPRPGITIRSVVGDKLHVAWIRIAPETALPIHHHPHEQIGVVLEGSIEVTIGGETRRVGPGEAYAVQGGVEHGGRTGEDGVLVLETFTPVRQEYLVPDEG